MARENIQSLSGTNRGCDEGLSTMSNHSNPSPVFWHVDDIDWTEVQRQQNADGSVSVVREKWPIIRPDFLSAFVHYESGMVVRRHGHRSNHVVFVLDGSGWIGDEPCQPGTHIHVPLGSAFGPIIAGPQGLTCWELSFGEFGGWGDQPELYAEAIAKRGITPLPDPPLDIGDWFVDPRGDWGGERPSPKVDGMESALTHGRDHVRVNFEDHSEIRFVDLVTFSSTLLDIEPGRALNRDLSTGNCLLWIVNGDATIGTQRCRAGTHIEVPPGADVGDIAAGGAGVVMLELRDLS